MFRIASLFLQLDWVLAPFHVVWSLLNFPLAPFCIAERIPFYGVPPDMSFDGSGVRMPDTGEYRAHAAECVRLAQQTGDPQSKSSLLAMARAWLALVTQGEKNREAPTLVYETSEPPRQVAQQQQQPQPKKE